MLIITSKSDISEVSVCSENSSVERGLGGDEEHKHANGERKCLEVEAAPVDDAVDDDKGVEEGERVKERVTHGLCRFVEESAILTGSCRLNLG